MPHKLFRIQRADPGTPARPVMLAIAGDSAAGKTTITRGLVEALGADRCTAVCDHRTGQFTRPVLVEPRHFVIVEGLLPLHTKLARACFDATVYLDPPEAIRREWKIRRDTAERGYTAEAVRAELERREPEEKAIWSRLGADSGPPACLGRTREGQRTEPLAITQLLLLYHLLGAAR